jgi:hypothetical protein
MLALRVLTNVFERSSGVAPGTIATFNPKPIALRGITSACWLSNVPWFPNLKVISQVVLRNCFWTLAGKLSIKAGKWLLPTTDFVAPVSKIP